MGLCLNNCPTHKRWVYLFPTHMHKIETKRTIKITNPKNNIEITEKEKRKPTRKNNINKTLKLQKTKKRKNIKNTQKKPKLKKPKRN
jgi:hypothetical protein